MVCYKLQGKRASLSINVGAAFRGQGSGRRLLFLATQELFDNSDATCIDAFVRPANQPSVRLFEGAGFRSVGIQTVRGEQVIHYVLNESVIS